MNLEEHHQLPWGNSKKNMSSLLIEDHVILNPQHDNLLYHLRLHHQSRWRTSCLPKMDSAVRLRVPSMESVEKNLLLLESSVVIVRNFVLEITLLSVDLML
jgi:hypothetical protein